MVWWKLEESIIARPDLSSTAKLVYACVDDHMRRHGKLPSYANIASSLGVGKSTVQDAVKCLKDKGLYRTASRTDEADDRTAHRTEGYGQPYEAVRPTVRSRTASRTPPTPPNKEQRCRDAEGIRGQTPPAGAAPPWDHDEKFSLTPEASAEPPLVKGRSKAKAKPENCSWYAVRAEAPTELQSDAFGRAWDEFVTYRATETPKRIRHQGVPRLLKQLAQHLGHDGAIARINLAMANGWQGLIFPEDTNGQRKLEQNLGGSQSTFRRNGGSTIRDSGKRERPDDAFADSPERQRTPVMDANGNFVMQSCKPQHRGTTEGTEGKASS